MYLTIQAIVLRVTDYNDKDALLTVLTRNHGKLTIKARGLRRKNSPLIAPCQLLAFGEFTMFEYKNQYTINEAHSIELFQSLRREHPANSPRYRKIGLFLRSGGHTGNLPCSKGRQKKSAK